MSVVACYLRSRHNGEYVSKCFSPGILEVDFHVFFLETPFGTTKGTLTHRRPRWKRLRTVSPIRTRKAAAIYHDEKKNRARMLNLCEPMGFDSYDVLFLFFVERTTCYFFFFGDSEKEQDKSNALPTFAR